MRRGTLQQSKIANLILNITLDNIFVFSVRSLLVSALLRTGSAQRLNDLNDLNVLRQLNGFNHFYRLLPLASCLIH